MSQSLDNKVSEYAKKFDVHKTSPKSLKWFNYRSAVKRYKEIVADVDFEDSSILDVGCGFGDILPFISAKTQHFTYTGIDMMAEFIAEATSRYAGYNFVQGDYFADPLNDKFDYVICCGALNSNLDNPLEYRLKAIASMFEHANKGIVFNMAGGSPQPDNADDSTIYYADSREILDYCLSLSSLIILRQTYSKKDFTIVVLKDKARE